MVVSTVILLLAVAAPQGDEAALQTAVTEYWDAVVAKDFVAALGRVHPDDRNLYIRRTQPEFRSWRLDSIDASESPARVAVTVEQLLESSGHYHSVRLIHRWVLSDSRWVVRVPKLDSDSMAALLGGRRGEEDTAEWPVLTVAPTVVTFPFLNPKSRGWFVISNGLESPVHIRRIGLDEGKFRLLEEAPDRVAANKVLRVRLEYIGDEDSKDRTSPLTLELEQDGEIRTFELTLLYNHISAATRTMLGITEEEARALKRGAPVRPAIRLPEAVKPPSRPPR